jgi:hypothetical protein
VAPIRKADVPDEPPVPIHLADVHEDGLPEDKAGRERLGPGPERLTPLGGVDPMQTDDPWVPSMKNRDRVPDRTTGRAIDRVDMPEAADPR